MRQHQNLINNDDLKELMGAISPPFFILFIFKGDFYERDFINERY